MKRAILSCVRKIERPVIQYKDLFIGGEFIKAEREETFDVFDPSFGKKICEVSSASANDTEKAINVAKEAFKEWKDCSPGEIANFLWKYADLIEEHSEEIAALESMDTGRPFEMTLTGDLPLTIQQFRYFAGFADKLEGKTLDMEGDFFSVVLNEPYGVCGLITPWNFPLFMFAWKVCPALATGNTVVLKPSSDAPLSVLYAAQLSKEVGIPDGVINVVPGKGSVVGEVLSRHPSVDKISFTGSTEIGSKLYQASGEEQQLKPMTLELGGKSPFIVFSDFVLPATTKEEEEHNNNMKQIVKKCSEGCFYNSGQVCSAATRIFVHEDIYDEFVEKAISFAEKRIVGDPFLPETEQGPQISEDHLQSILQYIEKGKREGAKLVTGGHRIDREGYFMEPTVFIDVEDEMTISKEEIFGPVLSVSRFREESEVIERANSSEYGLAAGVLTSDLNRAMRCLKKLEAGTVWINCWNVFDANIPFGGFKQSGWGKESSYYALKNFTKEKVGIFSVPGLKS